MGCKPYRYISFFRFVPRRDPVKTSGGGADSEGKDLHLVRNCVVFGSSCWSETVTVVRSYESLLHVSWRILASCDPVNQEMGFLSVVVWLADRMDVNLILAFVAIARHFKLDCSALREQNWTLYEADDCMLSISICTAPSKQVLSDGTKEWRDGGDDIGLSFLKEY